VSKRHILILLLSLLLISRDKQLQLSLKGPYCKQNNNHKHAELIEARASEFKSAAACPQARSWAQEGFMVAMHMGGSSSSELGGASSSETKTYYRNAGL
jgi:hypothetical protein